MAIIRSLIRILLNIYRIPENIVEVVIIYATRERVEKCRRLAGRIFLNTPSFSSGGRVAHILINRPNI